MGEKAGGKGNGRRTELGGSELRRMKQGQVRTHALPAFLSASGQKRDLPETDHELQNARTGNRIGSGRIFLPAESAAE
jgi:hypothetical protein